jgi:2-polyprenyl-3-methyl-5-hydroxy-6-metoxy-1,4-benzoquinol methylase
VSTRPDAEYTYQGGELGLFAEARNWKRYLRREIAPYLRGRVLEVGAGLGATTQALIGGGEKLWVCLEPDPDLVARVRERIASLELPSHCTAEVGTTADIAQDSAYDAVLYVDVLEHIEDDRSEMRRAARLLARGGHVVVLAPAHQWLYSPFDRAIGHYRRYTRRMLTAMPVPDLTVRRARYLDSAGLLASAGNRLLLRSSMPTLAQIKLWDRVLVPASQILDRVLLHQVGKSVLVVWQKV